MNNKLYTFAYQGWTVDGQYIHARITASHLLIAKNNLLEQGILIKKIRRKLFTKRHSFSAHDLLLMTQQLAVLINASLPLIFCLNTLAKQFKPLMQDIFKQMIIMIEQGASFSCALQKYSHLFPSYFIRLIQVGEESGQLNQVLMQLTAYQEKMLSRATALKKALAYPLCVFGISLLITLALLIFIVPQFQLLFADMTTSLPAMTVFVFQLSDFLQQLHMPHLLIVVILISLFYCLQNNAKMIIWKQEILYYLPFIGNITHDNQQTRYLRSLGLALNAGLPLMNALHLAAQVIQHTRLMRKIKHIPKQIEAGMSLKHVFTQTTQFSEIVIQLVAIGEQTSQLPTLLLQSATVLEQRMDQKIQQSLSLLQPILIVLLGLILGCLIIALYLPVFKLGTLY